LSSTYGCTDGTVAAENAPGALPGRTGASIQPFSKNCSAMSAISGAKPL
jgi:hypothetical protein